MLAKKDRAFLALFCGKERTGKTGRKTRIFKAGILAGSELTACNMTTAQKPKVLNVLHGRPKPP